MASKEYSTSKEIEAVQRTMEVRDPTRQTIVVGSAAVIAQFNELKQEAPIGCDDLDVLCPLPYFEQLLADGPHMAGISKFQVRWPKGRLQIRGATNKSIDIFPEDEAELLKFTACYSMSDRFYQINFDSCQSDLVEASELRCLHIGKILGWVAVVGREKDISMVKTVLPSANMLGMISDAAMLSIEAELKKSEAEKLLFPERYYARRTDRVTP